MRLPVVPPALASLRLPGCALRAACVAVMLHRCLPKLLLSHTCMSALGQLQEAHADAARVLREKEDLVRKVATLERAVRWSQVHCN